MKKQTARFIRIITVPPILATALLLLLYYSFGKEFAVPSELCMAIICLAVIPGLAYPVSFIMKKDSESLRKHQRNISFLLNLLGYLIAMFCSYLMDCSKMMKWIMTSYFLAVLLLTILNKGFRIKASGHACSCVMPYLFLSYYFGFPAVVICGGLYLIEFWASVVLKRHTIREFLIGSLTAILIFTITVFIFS